MTHLIPYAPPLWHLTHSQAWWAPLLPAMQRALEKRAKQAGKGGCRGGRRGQGEGHDLHGWVPRLGLSGWLEPVSLVGQALVRAEGPLFPGAARTPHLCSCLDSGRHIPPPTFGFQRLRHCRACVQYLSLSLCGLPAPAGESAQQDDPMLARAPPPSPGNHVGLVETHRLPKSPLLTSGLLSQAPIICVSQHLSELWDQHLLKAPRAAVGVGG